MQDYVYVRLCNRSLCNNWIQQDCCQMRHSRSGGSIWLIINVQYYCFLCMLGKCGINGFSMLLSYGHLMPCDRSRGCSYARVSMEAPIESKYIVKSLFASLTTLFQILQRKSYMNNGCFLSVPVNLHFWGRIRWKYISSKENFNLASSASITARNSLNEYNIGFLSLFSWIYKMLVIVSIAGKRIK